MSGCPAETGEKQIESRSSFLRDNGIGERALLHRALPGRPLSVSLPELQNCRPSRNCSVSSSKRSETQPWKHCEPFSCPTFLIVL